MVSTVQHTPLNNGKVDELFIRE